MIVFRAPKAGKSHLGHVVIELTENGTWEQFPEFAKRFTEQIGAEKIKHVDGPDVRFWDISKNGIKLNLGYDDFPNGISLMAYTLEGDEYLNTLFTELIKNADPTNGV
jgi:hypothetical protein